MMYDGPTLLSALLGVIRDEGMIVQTKSVFGHIEVKVDPKFLR
jgi:hypothetical protein